MELSDIVEFGVGFTMGGTVAYLYLNIRDYIGMSRKLYQKHSPKTLELAKEGLDSNPITRFGLTGYRLALKHYIEKFRGK